MTQLRPRLCRRTLAIVLAMVGLMVAGCGFEVGASGDQGYVDGSGVITITPEAERGRPGPIAGDSLEGEPIDVAELTGQVVVLNVWGSWCPPCRAEAGIFTEAAAELDGKPVSFLGINTRDASVDAARAFQRKFGVAYPSIFDPGGRTLLSLRELVKPSVMIPTTVVLDPQGRVAASIVGPISSVRTLVGLVEDAMTAPHTEQEQ